ncbi:MAG: amino acid adenylation domain-containing protein, partial [Burkholderiaceae bacterium]|nr:amino acid adenylation domain-containing protein [Burkholderiaceae bacterium]
QLSGLPMVHSVPLDHARPPMQSFNGAVHETQIDAGTRQALQALCETQGATLFMGLHAAFSALLARYSNETDIVVGSPIANREQAEVAGLIGFFVNTLVLRSDLSANPSFLELLGQSKRTLLDAYAHQQVPFEQIVERLQPERSLSHSPLFQIMLVLQNNEEGQSELPGLTLSAVEQEGRIAKYDLTLIVGEDEQGLSLAWEYNTDLFEPETIERMARIFTLLLKEVMDKPQQAVACANVLSKTERQQLLVTWNDTEKPYQDSLCIHQRFEALAKNMPDAPAVLDGDQVLTYSELNHRANRLAHLLLQRGIDVGETVGVALERSIALIVAELAIAKTGAAYVPLDAVLPLPRQAQMLNQCQTRYVVTQHGIATPEDVTRLELDQADVLATLETCSALNPDCMVDSAARAYIMYTSGSTGEGKGVEISHRGIGRLAINNGYLELGAGDRFACAANPAFDASTLEIWAPLQTGAAIVVIDATTLMEPEKLVGLMHEKAVSHLWMTVGLFNQYAQVMRPIMGQLRAVIVGGDALDPHVIERVLRECPPQRLLNGYGPTETTTFATTYDITEVIPGRGIPIGRPIGNTRIYILDTHHQPVPIGVAGELYIGGAGVAIGYLNRPDLTRERFLPDPFVAQAGARMYKTGDLGRYLPDGNIEYIGRNDQQVKIRGFRIELGEIEAALCTHEAVKAAVVVVKSGANGDKQLVAYAAVGEQLSGQASDEQDTPQREGLAEALRHHVGRNLPDYMVPAHVMVLDRLPLTANGKVDRKVLPEPDLSALQTSYVAPGTEVERIVCQLCQEILGMERVGLSDNFFKLGGHSLLATRLVGRINQTLHTSLPLQAVFAHATLGELAQAVADLDRETQIPALVGIERQGNLVSSFSQQRLWMLDQIDGGSAHYNMPAALRLTGTLDQAALSRALTTIVERHESLRTCFQSGADGQAYQVIQAARPLAIETHDLSGMASGEQQLK